jgi:hypothetical protein
MRKTDRQVHTMSMVLRHGGGETQPTLSLLELASLSELRSSGPANTMPARARETRGDAIFRRPLGVYGRY